MNKTFFHIFDYQPHKSGAVERFILRLARETRRAGYQSFFVFRDEPIDRFCRELREHAEVAWASGCPVSGRRLWKTFRLLRRVRPAVISFSYVPMFSPGTLLLARLPFAAHSVFVDRDSHQVSPKRGLRLRLAKLRGRVASRCYDVILSVSDYNRRRNVRELFVFPGKTLVIHNGIELNGAAAAPGGSARYLFYAGQLTREKGVPTLLRAFAHLVRQHPERAPDLWIAGAGPLAETLNTLAVWPAVKDRVRLLGVRDDVPALMAGSVATVVPSEWPEAAGLVALEAMASGRPLIVSDAGALPEYVTDCGLMFPRGDAEALAALLAQVTDPAAAHGDIVGRAMARVRGHFELNRMVADYIALFTRVAEGEPAGRPQQPR